MNSVAFTAAGGSSRLLVVYLEAPVDGTLSGKQERKINSRSAGLALNGAYVRNVSLY